MRQKAPPEGFSYSPFAPADLEACRHAVAVLELEKKAHKHRAKALALKAARLEKLLKRAKGVQAAATE